MLILSLPNHSANVVSSMKWTSILLGIVVDIAGVFENERTCLYHDQEYHGRGVSVEVNILIGAITIF